MKIKKQMVQFGRTPNGLLNDKSISLKAKGLFAFIESKPDDWDFSVEALKHLLKESTEAIISGLHELEQSGYLVRNKYHGKSGKWEIEYILYDKPTNNDEPYMENPYMVNPYIENPLNNKRKNTNKENKYSKDIYKTLNPFALKLAEKLRYGILQLYPNNATAKKEDCVKRWAIDIDKMIRIDGRNWQDINKAIDWAMNDSFWQRNIWSGKALREHYDRLEANARAKFMKNGTIII